MRFYFVKTQLVCQAQTLISVQFRIKNGVGSQQLINALIVIVLLQEGKLKKNKHKNKKT